MDSSPPTRRYGRPESPSQDSHYSLDLAALEIDSRSGASSPGLPAQQHIDRVLSEDIDGPSDFTQNMEYWMRGTAIPNPRSGTVRGSANAATARESLTAEPGVEGGGEERSASNHTPTGTPPKASVFGTSQQELRDPTDSPGWDPYVEEATPMPPPHRHFLQPTVEDYHSELTPLRAPLINSRLLPDPSHQQQREVEQDAGQSDPSTPGRPSSETISPVRSPAIQRPQPRQFSSQSEEASFERQLQELHSRCHQLEQLNTSLHTAVDKERQLRARDQKDFEHKLSEVSSRERELFEKASRASVQDRSYQRDVADHQHQLKQRDAALDRLRREYASLQQQMKQHKLDYEQELKAMEHDIDLANQSRDDALDSARAAEEDMAKIRAARDTASHHDASLRSHLSELQEQLRSLSLENESAKSARKIADEIATSIRAELTLLRQTQAEETTRLTGDHRRAVGMAEDLQKQLHELRQELHDQQALHQSELNRLRGTPLPIMPGSANDEDGPASHENPDDAKQAELNTAIFERDALQDELDAVKAELETTTAALAESEKDLKIATTSHANYVSKSIHIAEGLAGELETTRQALSKAQQDLKVAEIALAESKEEFREMESELYGVQIDHNHDIATNRALDAERKDALERNEAYWQHKWAAAQEERKIMVKELFRMWGREECGIADTSKGEVQMYRYKYVTRDRSKDKDKVEVSASPDKDIREVMEEEMRGRKDDAPKAQANPGVLADDKGLGNARKSTQSPRKAPRLSDAQIEELIAQHRALKAAAKSPRKSPFRRNATPASMNAVSDGESDAENFSKAKGPKHVRREKVARARAETLAQVKAEYEKANRPGVVETNAVKKARDERIAKIMAEYAKVDPQGAARVQARTDARAQN